MSTPYEVPLSALPQQFSLELKGIQYNLTVTWNPALVGWVLDIRDVNLKDIITGIPLITGVDLLGPYQYLGIGGSLVVQTDHNPNAVPTYENLGDTSHLYFVVD